MNTLIDSSGNSIVNQLPLDDGTFVNILACGEAYISDGCWPSGEDMGVEPLSGLHYPGNCHRWVDQAFLAAYAAEVAAQKKYDENVAAYAALNPNYGRQYTVNVWFNEHDAEVSETFTSLEEAAIFAASYNDREDAAVRVFLADIPIVLALPARAVPERW